MSFSIKSPCAQSWTSMAGDERVRFCGVCEKHVHNLSALTAEEVSELSTREADLCVRAMVTLEGELVTKPCAAPRASVSRRHRFLGFGAGIVAASAAWGAADPATTAVVRLQKWVHWVFAPATDICVLNPRHAEPPRHRNIEVTGAMRWHDPNTNTP